MNRESPRTLDVETKLRSYAKSVNSNTKLQSVPCDMQKFDSVRTAAAIVNNICEQTGGLDVLICNAGVMALKDVRTSDGYDVQMQTNHLSHVLLISLVSENLKMAGESRGEARVIMHSSSARDLPWGMLDEKYFLKCKINSLGGDKMVPFLQLLGFPGTWQRYHQTKLANSAFAMEFARRLHNNNSKVKSLAADPGFAHTKLSSNSSEVSSSFTSLMVRKGQSAEDGCMPAALAAFAEDSNSGDMYIPENITTGRPIKSIVSGVPVKAKTEKLTCHSKNMDIAWASSEEALNIKIAIP